MWPKETNVHPHKIKQAIITEATSILLPFNDDTYSAISFY